MQRTTMKKGQGVRTGEGTKETCGIVGDIISNSRRQLWGVESCARFQVASYSKTGALQCPQESDIFTDLVH
jgi:hypothetical protein